ncbi:hypothetical protein GGR55DRAFT_662122 [Xylaria sp. FL0064]|nr:hypothetical protein GGR55DRAFT_662122 [Xylaria sp. FL0064]
MLFIIFSFPQCPPVVCTVEHCGAVLSCVHGNVRYHLNPKHPEYKQGRNLWSPIRDLERGIDTDDAVPSPRKKRIKTPLSSIQRQFTGPPRRPRARPQMGRLWDQAETPPVSQEQLVAEVKGTYAGLMMVGPKYIGVLRDTGKLGASIEDNDLRDREACGSASYHCYSIAMTKVPECCRLHNHLSLSERTTICLWLSSCSIPCLYTPAQSGESHNSRLLELLPSNYQPDGKPRKASTPKIRADIPLNKPLSNHHNAAHSLLNLYASIKIAERTLKYCVWVLVTSLPYSALAAVPTSRLNSALGSGQLEQPKSASNDGALVWFWYPTVIVGILVGEFAAVHILGEPLLLHGVSMGISAGAFLLMIFNQHEIPFHVQFSTWGMCAILTIAWTHHDTLNLRPEMRRLAVFAVIVIAFLLDGAISGAFASAGNSVFAASDSPSTAFIFTTFLLPCMAMSAFLCSGIRALYRQVVQHLAGVDTVHG